MFAKAERPWPIAMRLQSTLWSFLSVRKPFLLIDCIHCLFLLYIIHLYFYHYCLRFYTFLLFYGTQISLLAVFLIIFGLVSIFICCIDFCIENAWGLVFDEWFLLLSCVFRIHCLSATLQVRGEGMILILTQAWALFGCDERYMEESFQFFDANSF